MRAAEESCINNFSNALASLDDMKTVHTDPNLASIRRGMRNVLQHDRSETISEHLTQAFALYGIAQALAFRFEGTMHHEFAKGALRNTSMLFEEYGFRELLCRFQDWVPQDSLTNDEASSCLCPIMGYLQQITCATKMEHWVEGAVNSEA
ncbi:hypothetical protein BDV98DRAFT_562554 [Pterulicium gracile]|uniref:Uncharacterized protein n=1 Tax=Pterulicium gracile TaxID=1884261 RepID=A0A5C3QRM3_9AGAR|nr:hypothetical protein BDV98DRAFT_562554 [Pterula gracilis]